MDNADDSDTSSEIIVNNRKNSFQPPLHPVTFDKKKAEQYYEIYKNKILDNSQDKLISNYKEKIFNLIKMEIEISRIEKYEPGLEDMGLKIAEYLDTAKKLLEEDEKKLNDENLRNIILLKYYLALKLKFFCRSRKDLLTKPWDTYFKEKADSIPINKVISEIKDLKRLDIARDEPLEGIFKSGRKRGNSIWTILKWITLGIVTLSGTVSIYLYKYRKYYSTFNKAR